MIVGFYGTNFATQALQLCICIQTLCVMSKGTISSQSVSLALGSTNKAGLTWESVMISMMRYNVGDRVDLGGWLMKIWWITLNPACYTLPCVLGPMSQIHQAICKVEEKISVKRFLCFAYWMNIVISLCSSVLSFRNIPKQLLNLTMLITSLSVVLLFVFHEISHYQFYLQKIDSKFVGLFFLYAEKNKRSIFKSF